MERGGAERGGAEGVERGRRGGAEWVGQRVGAEGVERGRRGGRGGARGLLRGS